MAPRLSFVLAAHREQAFLEPCLASILGQDMSDLEVVAVDDASDDHAPEVLDAIAERDSRVRVTHLEERVGRGAARNLAVEQAAGDYIWVVRATDLVAGIPVLDGDVALLRSTRESPIGRRSPGPRQTGLDDVSPDVFDKVFRRGLLGEFGPAGFDELTAIWPALLAAERITTPDEPAYIRRQPPNAVINGTVWDALDQYAALGDRGPQLRAAIRRHGAQLARNLHGGERRRFLRRVEELSQTKGLAIRAEAGAARRRLRALPGGAKRGVKRATARRVALDPSLAVFAAYWYRGYSCNPRAIYERARELRPNLHGVWIVNEGVSMPDGVDHVVAGSDRYHDVLARATYFVNNVNFPNHVVKRPGQIHVMTHHGTPLKRMGMDLAHLPDQRGLAGVLRRCRRWDYAVSANVFTSLQFERAYPTRYTTLETGYPRNDVLARATDADRSAARAALGIADDRTAVLYTPTHREYSDDPTPPLDLATFADGLGPGHVVMARLHYFHDEHPLLRELHEAGRIRDVASHPSIEELMLAADLLVTDYSSIMFDYAVLDRPIAIHAPDWEVYRARRGTYFDLLTEGPGPVVRTDAELIELVNAGPGRPRPEFRERFTALEDGNASQRVIEAVFR